MDTACVGGYLSYEMDHGDMPRGKKEVWDKDGKLEGLLVQIIAELRRIDARTGEHVIKKTRPTVCGIVLVSYNNSVTHACTRVYC